MKVIVQVPERQDFNGRFRAGRFWPVGKTVAEVTAEQFSALEADSLLAVLRAPDDAELTDLQAEHEAPPLSPSEARELRALVGSLQARVKELEERQSAHPEKPTEIAGELPGSSKADRARGR